MNNLKTRNARQQGVSLVVALVMLVVLTLIGVSSMNTAIVELKMAGSAQQQSVALNRADELLVIGEDDVEAIAANAAAFDFGTAGDGYYTVADNIDIYDIDWPAQGLTSIQGATPDDTYVVEYVGEKKPTGSSVRVLPDGKIAGEYVYSYRITARSAAGKNAVRLVQSIYVTANAP